MHAPLSRASRLLCATALALALLVAPAHAADAPFTPRFALTVHGDIAAVGNTLLTCPTATAGCTNAQDGIGGTLNNNSWNMTPVNVAGGTTNSSSATVTLPAGATVMWAGLYWGADTNAGTNGVAAPNAAARGTVSFKAPGGSYQSLSATAGDVLDSSVQATRYRAFRDVTALVSAAGGGTYSVADVQTGTGQDRFAGWALFVAYRDNAQPTRRLNVYDGLGTVDSAHTFTTAVAPFHTPATGAVTAKAGLLSFEGDASLATETATFNGHALTDALNPTNNAMNSTIEAGGTRFSAKSPDYVNQFGVDLDTFDNAGTLANDQSAATLYFGSTNEYFMPSAFFLVSDEGPATSTGAGPTIAGPPSGGAAHDGEALSADPGAWHGTGQLTYSYQWQQCDANGANCHDIAGATGSSYTPSAADIGGTVRVVVTATNDAGSSTPTASAPIAIRASAAPVNTAPPALSGPAAQGQALTIDTGTWSSGGVSYTYVWQRCDDDGAHCVDIPGATDATYTPTAQDVGYTLRAVVTATNDAGANTTTTAPSAPVVAASDPNDLSGVPGGLLGEGSCQQLVGGAKYRRVALAGIGTVRVRAYTSGPALQSSPLRLTTEVAGARSVAYLFDGRPVAAARGARHPATLTPAQIGKVGTHTLKTAVRGRRGAAKYISLTLKTEPCQMLFTAQRWRTTAGAGLRLRIDSRTALRQLSFAVPSALLPGQGAKRRTVGFIRLYVAGKGKPVRFPLTLPARGARSVMLAASGRPTVSLRRGGVRVTGLPAGTAVAEVTLYRVTKLDRVTSPRAYTVRATVTRDAAAAQTLSAQPRPPR
jgi:Protein of unknown function (DUF3344)